MKQKKVINETQLRTLIKETITKIFKENYPAGAEYDPRAPWNQPDSVSETVTVYGTAYYENRETGEEKEVPFEVDVEVEGEYLPDYDDGEKYSYFQPFEDTDYYSLVVNSGKIPNTLSDGLKLVDIDIDNG